MLNYVNLWVSLGLMSKMMLKEFSSLSIFGLCY